MKSSIDTRWWRAEEDVHKPLYDLVTGIMAKRGNSRRTWLESMRSTYLDEPLSAEQTSQLSTLEYSVPNIRTPWPALRSGVDAMDSKIAKTHPRCMVLTEGGSYDLQNRAELLTQWLDGEFDRLDLAAVLERVWLDTLIYGTGVVYVGPRNDMPHCERVWCGDLHVDPIEELHDCVRSMYRTRAIDIGVLSELFPKHRAAIEKATPLPPDPRLSNEYGEASDMVLAVEGWRLADGPDTPGRHSICIEGTTLLDDRKWVDTRFPFAMAHWSRDPSRFWGRGLVEQMLAPQSELNEIARTNSESRHLFVPQLHCEGEGMQVEQLDNEVGRIFRRPMGTAPPQLLSPGSIFLDMAQLEELYIQRVYNLAGLSELSVASQKPAGLNSGVAITNFSDVESERFAKPGRSWERLHMEVGKLLIDSAEKICGGNAGKAAKLKAMGGKDMLESVTYADARFGDQPHRIRVFPVSQLSNSVSAKLDEIDRMVNSGMITDMDDARELADIPDLKQYNSIASAGRRLVRKLIDKALRHGVATSPHPFMPLPYLIKFGSLTADYAEETGAPEDNIQALRDMVQAAIELENAIKAPPPMPAAANTAPPPTPPMPSPPPGMPMMPPGLPPDPSMQPMPPEQMPM